MNPKVFNTLYIIEILLIFSPSIGLILNIHFLNQQSFILSFLGKLAAAITLFSEYYLSDKNERATQKWWMDILAYYFLILAIGAWIPKYSYENIVNIFIILFFIFFFYKRWNRLDKESKTWNTFK